MNAYDYFKEKLSAAPHEDTAIVTVEAIASR